MIPPPEGHENRPHKVGKHYYMQIAEMTGHNFQHDEYDVIANWLITYIAITNETITDYPTTTQ